MRLTLVFATLVVASPAVAQQSMSWREASSVPCKTFLTLPGTALYEPVQGAVVDHVGRFEDSGQLGSACNIGDYVSATCKAHPGMSVGRAVDDLFKHIRSGQRLPSIKMCGA